MWIYSNIQIDIDEKIESLCEKCKEEIKKKTCTRCGKEIHIDNKFERNSNFDLDRFKTLSQDGE